MSKITELSVQKNNKDRANLYLDGQFKTGISVETAYKMQLRVGDEIDEKGLLDIVNSDDEQRALTKGIEYISKTLKTKRQVKDYLIKKGFSESIAWGVIDKLKGYGYIDDKEYAERFIESTSKTQGKRLVQYKLLSKGIKKEDIESAYLERDDDMDTENAKALAIKYMKNKENTIKNVRKTYKYLISRGFSYEQADSAISSFKGED